MKESEYRARDLVEPALTGLLGGSRGRAMTDLVMGIRDYLNGIGYDSSDDDGERATRLLLGGLATQFGVTAITDYKGILPVYEDKTVAGVVNAFMTNPEYRNSVVEEFKRSVG